MATRTVSNERQNVVTKSTDHVAVAIIPDYCFVPGESAPQPFENCVRSELIDELRSQTVRIALAEVCLSVTRWGPPSDPAHRGKNGGVFSRSYRGAARAVSFSRDMFVEGCPVVRERDFTLHNEGPGGFNTLGQVVDGSEHPRHLPYEQLVDFCAARGFHVTATTGGRHNPGSAHYHGRAVDVRVRDHTRAEVDRFIREARRAGIHVRDERTRPPGQRVWSGPHLHLQLPPGADILW